MSLTRAMAAVAANLLFNNDAVFRAAGVVNRRFRFLNRVFLAYPVRRPIPVRNSAFARLVERYRWSPAIIGIFRQGRAWGLAFSVTGAEAELIDVKNSRSLEALLARIEGIGKLLHADRCALAGVLPSVLASRGIPHGTTEAETAAACVVHAIRKVQMLDNLAGCPIVILGSRGFVGSRVVERLAGDLVYPVDRNRQGPVELPLDVRGKAALLVNLTWADVLEGWVEQMWPGLVVLNEVYPPPSTRCCHLIRVKGVKLYHLAGVAGTAIPPFPGAYAGGIPCCAADSAGDPEILLARLA
ncbi:MAG TPA: hypothetical protein VGM43_11660 [Bryobacteraceae bacterium]